MHVTTIEDIPNGPHWAIAIVKQVTRSEPGWNRDDPPSTYTAKEIDMQTFTNEAEWRKEVEALMLRMHSATFSHGITFKAYHVDKVATATLKPVVEII